MFWRCAVSILFSFFLLSSSLSAQRYCMCSGAFISSWRPAPRCHNTQNHFVNNSWGSSWQNHLTYSTILEVPVHQLWFFDVPKSSGNCCISRCSLWPGFALAKAWSFYRRPVPFLFFWVWPWKFAQGLMPGDFFLLWSYFQRIQMMWTNWYTRGSAFHRFPILRYPE